MDPVRLLAILISLGLVIFVHELGHFLVARWAGVLVERFSIGFGPVLLSFRRGETEYALSAIPLGGYVKMLGQTDTPEVEEQTDDERSYQNKSVGARMAIISAGVVMNLIFGFFCFMIAYWLGVPYRPAIVGETIPAKPAWTAGIQPGDHIVGINGTASDEYETLLTEVALTRPPNGRIELDVEREGKRIHFELTPVQDRMKPVIGLGPSKSLTLYPTDPVSPGTPAARANPPFEGGDKITAVDGVPVSSHAEFSQRMFNKQREAVTLTVERKGKQGATGSSQEIRLEPNFIRTVGLEMQMGKVVGVQDNSPAALATDPEGKPAPILPTDTIVAVDGERDIDPMRLPDRIAEKAGQKVELTLLRQGTEQKEIKLHVVPRDVQTWAGFFEAAILEGDTPLTIPSLGVAYEVLPTVRKVIPESPAAKAAVALKPDDVIKSVEYTVELNQKVDTVKVDVKEETWPSLFWSLQFPVVKSVTFTAERAGQAEPVVVTLTPQPDNTWPLRIRGLGFQDELRDRKESSLWDAAVLGMHRTKESVLNLYLFLRGLLLTTLSFKNLAGPITIAQVAYHLAAEDIPLLILFLGSLSINLAVVNFLPIPILDGGHMALLTYELITRRKPTERMVLAANYLGLCLILGLMVVVFGLDIMRLLGVRGI
ncbi:MAG: RIP metalloprotease RseP [Planctomycetota bacterium]